MRDARVNAKDELLRYVNSGNEIKCALIEYNDRTFILKVNYTESEYVDFLNSIDFTYYSGYGGQELFGLVWFCNGTWLSRGEYDGSEWWNYNFLPKIPNECL